MGLFMDSTGRQACHIPLSGGCVWPPKSTHSHINANNRKGGLANFAAKAKGAFSPAALAA